MPNKFWHCLKWWVSTHQARLLCTFHNYICLENLTACAAILSSIANGAITCNSKFAFYWPKSFSYPSFMTSREYIGWILDPEFARDYFSDVSTLRHNWICIVIGYSDTMTWLWRSLLQLLSRSAATSAHLHRLRCIFFGQKANLDGSHEDFKSTY